MTASIKYENGPYDPDYAPYMGWYVIRKLGYDIVYLCIKFDDSSSSHSRDNIGGLKFKMGHVTLIMPLLKVI